MRGTAGRIKAKGISKLLEVSGQDVLELICAVANITPYVGLFWIWNVTPHGHKGLKYRLSKWSVAWKSLRVERKLTVRE